MELQDDGCDNRADCRRIGDSVTNWESEKSVPNRLAESTSPYLLQHADNPVEWYQWGNEALQKAKEENKPILLSIGYSACHWCHVMAHESFEDPETAAYLNEHFVNIKVDREERPDIDQIYMATVQAMTGHGGWPLTAFLTPEGVPFYGGTYWPNEERQGMPSFSMVLEAVMEAYTSKPEDITGNAGQMAAFLKNLGEQSPKSGTVDQLVVTGALDALAKQFDTRNGGFGGAPKFPQPAVLEFLLRSWRRTKDPRVALMIKSTLDHMADGGINDQIGGGFHRYAVDEIWLVPHFEKMLYDNALLAKLYLDGWRAFGDAGYRQVVEQTLDWTLREMTGPDGQFWSALDADTEGEEGKFYVWTLEEMQEVLGDQATELVTRVYGVTSDGNFEDTNVLSRVSTLTDVAEAQGTDLAELQAQLDSATSKLLAARSLRVRPGVDNKALANWNAMMITAMAEAGAALDRPDYLSAAEKAASFLIGQMRPNGQFKHSWNGRPGDVPAFLDDYALSIEAFLSLYTATFNDAGLHEAIALADEMLLFFKREDGPGFYDTGSLHEGLVARPRDLHDGATPSGNAVAADVLLRLSAMTSRRDYLDAALGVLQMMSGVMSEQPLAAGRFLAATERYIGVPREIAIAGKPDADSVKAMANVVHRRYEPNLVMGLAANGRNDVLLPFLEERPARNGKTTAYLCEHFSCMPPVMTVAELAQLLENGTGILWREF